MTKSIDPKADLFLLVCFTKHAAPVGQHGMIMEYSMLPDCEIKVWLPPPAVCLSPTWIICIPDIKWSHTPVCHTLIRSFFWTSLAISLCCACTDLSVLLKSLFRRLGTKASDNKRPPRGYSHLIWIVIMIYTGPRYRLHGKGTQGMQEENR